MSKKKIILIGGGGHCKSCIDVIESTNEYEILGIIDLKEKVGQNILNYKIIGSDENLEIFKKKCDYACITVGQIKSAELRKYLFEKLIKIGFKLPVLKASTAYISKSAIINEGTIIMHNAIVNSAANIGKNNIINTKALVEHDVIIGNHNHISTGVNLNGSVQIGNECFIGSGSTISNNITLRNNIFVGMKSSVTKDIGKSGFYIGNPLKKSNKL